MNEFDRIENIKQIAEYYGFDHQCIKAIEEFSEATKAICKYQLWYNDIDDAYLFKSEERDNIIEEIADSTILIFQLVYLMNANKEFKDMLEYKISRTLERMKQEQ